jgi:hypothetical protein
MNSEYVNIPGFPFSVNLFWGYIFYKHVIWKSLTLCIVHFGLIVSWKRIE